MFFFETAPVLNGRPTFKVIEIKLIESCGVFPVYHCPFNVGCGCKESDCCLEDAPEECIFQEVFRRYQALGKRSEFFNSLMSLQANVPSSSWTRVCWCGGHLSHKFRDTKHALIGEQVGVGTLLFPDLNFAGLLLGDLPEHAKPQDCCDQ